MILITGAARSGTTLTASILQACGAELGAVNQLKESHAVREGLVKPYLTGIGADPLGQYPLPDTSDVVMDPTWRGRVLTALGDGVNTYKGAKMCLMWQLWDNAFPEAQWVIVRRERAGIVSSCMRTSFMRAFKRPEGWEQWVSFHEDRFEEMKQAFPDRVREVWPAQFLAGDEAPMKELIEWCGLGYNSAAATACVKPGLFRKG